MQGQSPGTLGGEGGGGPDHRSVLDRYKFLWYKRQSEWIICIM